MSVYAFPASRTAGRYTDLSTFPSTEQGWKDRYDRLWCAYLSEPYDVAEVREFHLFRALDDNNDEIDVTRRVYSLYRFITEIDVGGILGGRVALEVEDGLTNETGTKATEEERAALLLAGEAVWKRSLVNERIEPWVRTTAALGDFYVEAVRTNGEKPYRTTLVISASKMIIEVEQVSACSIDSQPFPARCCLSKRLGLAQGQPTRRSF